MPYRLAIFDFDGTLADSFPFFSSVFSTLADRHGFRRVEPHEVSALRRCDAREIMAKLGLPSWKLPIVARSFKALMRGNASRVPLFPGVCEMLERLNADGVELAIVSSNSRDNIERVLGADHARLIRHYECGASIFGKRPRLRKVLRKAGVDRGEAIYIGDQPTDHDAARAELVAFGAVAWGYGDIDALRARKPEAAFEHVGEITALFQAVARP
jgi:phosphoglycolate phosphatase